MPHASAAQTVLPLGDQPEDICGWDQILSAAFADPDRTSGFLSQAEAAVRAQPGNGLILLLATTAALLDQNPERAQVFLKRFSKRYVAIAPYHLLRALALAEENKLGSARSMLDAHGLTNRFDTLQHLSRRLDTAGMALSPARPDFRNATSRGRHKRTASDAARRGAQSPVKIKLRERQTKSAPVAVTETPAAPPAPAGLPLIDIEIPFTAALDLAPLLTAMQKPPDSDGGWYGLRERFAHLGLAQGFDELLCLPHLRGIETFWYQVETVRKVLKQFRGRVLLADEVGLGKTIEAGMVLKEYLLRGMVDSVLVLTPASLVGQWREELETKFDIPCATTHDALLRSDPDRFWNQQRLVASLALARRSDHAARLIGRSFDLVIVDEAHHLRDRTSQSYKLVDALNKRFLLLLSATPVQNDLTELYNVLTLLKPGIFKTLKEFRAAYMTPGKPRQPANPERLRALMRDAMVRNTRAVVALKLPRRHAVTIRVDGRRASGRPTRSSPRPRAGWRPREAAETGSRCVICSVPPDHLRPRQPPPSSASPAAMPMTRAGTRWRSAGRRSATAARRRPCSTCCGAIRTRRSWSLSTTARRSITSPTCLARERFAFARFEGGMSGPDKDAAIVDFCAGAGAPLHRIGRRGPQHPVLQYADQFRRAVESDVHRAAHRTHRSHWSAARGIRVQSRDP